MQDKNKDLGANQLVAPSELTVIMAFTAQVAQILGISPASLAGLLSNRLAVTEIGQMKAKDFQASLRFLADFCPSDTAPAMLH